MECVDGDRFFATIAEVAIERPPDSEGWQTIQELCASRLAELGFEVELHEYATGVNVVGTLPGATRADEHVVVSAHYDHVAGCPGADDNGSGVAAALEIAAVLSRVTAPRSLVVAFWDEEEWGKIGSKAWTAEVAAGGLDVSASLVFDTFGYACHEPGCQTVPTGFDLVFPDQVAALEDNDYRGDFVALFADDGSHDTLLTLTDLAAGIGLGQLSGELALEDLSSPLFSDLRRSDHASFWDVGYPSIFVTDTADFRNPYYHCTAGPDTPDTLDPAYATDVVRATLGAMAEALGVASGWPTR